MDEDEGNWFSWDLLALAVTLISHRCDILSTVSKAQHGCIDCLALMLCTELQAPKEFGKSISGKACDTLTNICLG